MRCVGAARSGARRGRRLAPTLEIGALVAAVATTALALDRAGPPVASPAPSQARAGSDAARAASLRSRATAPGTRDEDARPLLEEARDLARRTGDRRLLARVLDDLGPVYRRLGEPRTAQRSYDEALALARGLGDLEIEAQVLHDAGVLAHKQGDYDQAVNRSRQARRIWRRLKCASSEAQTLVELGRSYTMLARDDAARAAFEAALALRPGHVEALRELGWCDYLEGRYLAALERYAAAMKRVRPGDEFTKGTLIDRQASVLLRLGRLSRAQRLYADVERLWARLGEPAAGAHVASSLALVAEQRRDWRAAESHYARSVEGLARAREWDSLAHVLFSRARMRARLRRLAEARADLRTAQEHIEKLRAKVEVPASRAAYLAARHGLFRLDTELALLQKDEDATRVAFEVAERGRARGLLDSLAAEGGPDQAAGDRAALEDVATRIAAEQAVGQRLLERGASQVETAAHEERLGELLREREELERRSRRDPRRAEMIQPLGLVETQALLGDDTLMLAYALGDERSAVWLVGRRTFQRFDLPRGAAFEPHTRALREAWGARPTPLRRKQGIAAARALAELALPPALQARLEPKRLIIVTDGALRHVPLAALPVRPRPGATPVAPPDADWPRDRVPLFADHDVTYVPSASVLSWLRGHARQASLQSRGVAVLADPVYTADDSRLDPVRDRLPANGESHEPETTPRLRFTGDEASQIVALVRPPAVATRKVGFEATKEAVQRGDLRASGIWHFSTHGFVDARRPELSYLALSRFDAAGRRIGDGDLHVHEIERLDAPADLVVLSACETALGRDLPGEGSVGMSQAFLRAGAARVIVSLWRIDERASAELMRRFYIALLGRGLAPAVALAEAQRSLWADPVYGQGNARTRAGYRDWAAFVIEGDF